MEDNKNYNSIDLFKLLMAVAVVAIHTNPIVNWTNPVAIKIIVMIEGWAVPFFFVASGFFLFNTVKEPYQESIKRLDKYIFKILKMYCAWTLISFPLTLYGYLISDNSLIECMLSYIKYFLFVGKLYNSYHLWYLLALIYAVIVIRIMVKKGLPLIVIAAFSIILYLLAETMTVLMEYINVLEGGLCMFVSLYQYVFNKGGVFTGMIYVSAGMLIAVYQWRINKWVGGAVIIVLNIFKLFINDIAAHLLLPIEASVLLLVLFEIKLPKCELWKTCRKTSTIIYLSHLIFFSIYTFIVIKNPNKLGFDSFIVTILCSALNAILLISLQRRKRFRLLDHII